MLLYIAKYVIIGYVVEVAFQNEDVLYAISSNSGRPQPLDRFLGFYYKHIYTQESIFWFLVLSLVVYLKVLELSSKLSYFIEFKRFKLNTLSWPTQRLN